MVFCCPTVVLYLALIPPDLKNVIYVTIKTDDVRTSTSTLCRVTRTAGPTRILAATPSGDGVRFALLDPLSVRTNVKQG